MLAPSKHVNTVDALFKYKYWYFSCLTPPKTLCYVGRFVCLHFGCSACTTHLCRELARGNQLLLTTFRHAILSSPIGDSLLHPLDRCWGKGMCKIVCTGQEVCIELLLDNPTELPIGFL